MQNVNRGTRDDRRAKHSGVTEEGQTDIPGVEGEALQSFDLNHATQAQLEAIDALGPELAQALVQHRVHHGHFTSWAQVATVPGLGAPQIAALQRATRLVEHPHPSDDRAHRGEPLQRGGLP